jgi:5-methylthioribose kinase
VREALAEARLVLGEGDNCLVHGDFLPRNWLRSDGRLHVVDTEFSYFGRPETDAGSLLAGLLFLRADRDALAAAARVLQAGCVRYDFRMTATFAGVHLCALLDGVRRGSGEPRGSEAAALIRRAGRAIESGSLSQLVPG